MEEASSRMRHHGGGIEDEALGRHLGKASGGHLRGDVLDPFGNINEKAYCMHLGDASKRSHHGGDIPEHLGGSREANRRGIEETMQRRRCEIEVEPN